MFAGKPPEGDRPVDIAEDRANPRPAARGMERLQAGGEAGLGTGERRQGDEARLCPLPRRRHQFPRPNQRGDCVTDRAGIGLEQLGCPGS